MISEDTGNHLLLVQNRFRIHGILSTRVAMGALAQHVISEVRQEFSMGKRAIIQHGLGYAFYGWL